MIKIDPPVWVLQAILLTGPRFKLQIFRFNNKSITARPNLPVVINRGLTFNLNCPPPLSFQRSQLVVIAVLLYKSCCLLITSLPAVQCSLINGQAVHNSSLFMLDSLMLMNQTLCICLTMHTNAEH